MLKHLTALQSSRAELGQAVVTINPCFFKNRFGYALKIQQKRIKDQRFDKENLLPRNFLYRSVSFCGNLKAFVLYSVR